MSKIVRFHATGGPEVLTLDDIEVREPGHGEIRIRTRALGVNRADAMLRNNRLVKLPSGIGWEASGEVDAIGPDVEGFTVGDAISLIPCFRPTDYPIHGELAIAPATAVARHPDSLSWEQTAALWGQYLTAYGALIETADLKAGDTVLISAASSSVGLAAIQVARSVGARPVALTRSSAKRRRLLDEGAEAVVVTGEEDVVTRVNELTDGHGARVIFDPVGGPALAGLIGAAAPGGTVIVYGVLNSEATTVPVMGLINKSLTIRGYKLWELTTDVERRKVAVDWILDGLAGKTLRPVIDTVFPLEDIVGAHRRLESGSQVGKIVVTVPH
ncbi:NADPH:quinone reductase [Mesorhizobium sp. M1C.F.Ca.ET.193.01.1.1]|uniref:zinc-dependent alcohol dehydrogenase family protein n=2 Tax=Mesorhizobium TaxID=68287 RepID=UPI000FD5F03E|nr:MULTISPECIES: zinc-dependent alcohol dehydrogenase family protein [unclassified Mesorhizobium]TGS92188.1 NADPH:quinone reductase [bacterium M00.F.Ca.ET.177.01.1.1]TGQ50076.1 NADPH:quinone reductase [Mesorhizobium sp. M1C.F.Ca.ET.210.01.1.1]TGQ64768.1 NADPH:quinone reductase [Mesorhizobium sp. M1C.F.Ca.ET.212.01.1.1]TGQ98550.1 NADPH:quinone reductase [Mesorhizobium sp. M1C.F.Ca.ET.204.01.1.1]TGR18687.1 NADPH:quinone reductase [Mesorhizobium sp. M1C.F.Ca.ET.196.01.1.1]